ncbi:MAG: hypothetical protein ABIR96_03825 [Bdellovibrionota bacterium]
MKLQNIVLGLCLVALAACGKRLEGDLQVTRAITINTKKGQQVSIPAGTYATVIKAGSSSASVVMATQSKKIAFVLPAIQALKDRWGHGRVYLTGSQIGQNFDIDLDLDVSSSDSNGTSRVESCVYDTRTYQDYVCRDVSYPGREHCVQNPGTNGDGRSDFSCHTEYYSRRECGYETRTENIYGQRTIYGHYTTVRRTGTFKIVRDGATLARLLDNKQSRTNFVETDSGNCQP